MAYAPKANIFYEREGWRRPLALSFAFHAAVILSIVAVGLVLEPRGQSNWGENPGEAVSATLVTGAAVPIPRPMTQTDNIVVNGSKGETVTPPQPKAAETEDGVTIPGQVTKPRIDKAVTPAVPKPHVEPTPTTAVPFGEGGAPKGPYGVFSAPSMKGGFSFENADFGSKFPWYVEVVKRKVQSNWLTYELDPHIQAPHKGGISFDIRRDGSVANVQLAQSSGVPLLDQSALRAVQRVDTFGPIPEGNSVNVTFWFDYPPK
jgi:protein TonB